MLEVADLVFGIAVDSNDMEKCSGSVWVCWVLAFDQYFNTCRLRCVYVCACARARACVRACVCVRVCLCVCVS